MTEYQDALRTCGNCKLAKPTESENGNLVKCPVCGEERNKKDFCGEGRWISEDAVSRKAVMDIVYLDPGIDLFREKMLKELPPVLPKQPVGKWIEAHGYCSPGGDPVWRCSECGKGVHAYGIEHGSYGANIASHQWVTCPNCGAVMEGEE